MEIPTLNIVVPDVGGSPNMTIQSAINTAAQAPGAVVWIPSNYKGTDTYTNPLNIPIFDMRGTGSVSFATGGGTPGGANTQIQFNDNGALGGNSGLTYDKTTNSFFATVNHDGQSGLSDDTGNNLILVDGSDFNDITIQAFNPAASLNLISQGSIALVLESTATGPTQAIEIGNESIDAIKIDKNAHIGFFNAAPVAKPTVTGAKGGNAALASFITALANLGLITDSTSA